MEALDLMHSIGVETVKKRDKLEEEILGNENIVFDCISMTEPLFQQLIKTVLRAHKKVSIKNLDPGLAFKCRKSINQMATEGLLEILYVPIYSENMKVLIDMGKNAGHVKNFILMLPFLRQQGVILATEVICGYKDFPDAHVGFLKKYFDHIYERPYMEGDFYISDTSRMGLWKGEQE